MNAIDTHEKLIEASNAQGGSCAAFACELKDGGFVVDTGITLRDHFAGQALAGRTCVIPQDEKSCLRMARDYYRMADAMLKVREASKP
ncbi:MAG: hypothetical protein ACTHJQ_22005 [Rhizobiaceae bacterium]